jgi:hypothetical protein
MIKSMVMENSVGQQAISTKETILMIRDVDLERCIGSMEASTKDIGKKACKMD